MVFLKYYNAEKNIGDMLAPIILNWMVRYWKLNDESTCDVNLLAVGSILASSFFNGDCVVWGTGTHYIEDAGILAYHAGRRKLDIRAVRGPITRRMLEFAGYPSPCLYGDPAVLMPRIYPSKRTPEGKITLIRHVTHKAIDCPAYINQISTESENYKMLIDEICASKKVISSSLHGVILAESYGVPAVFLQDGRQDELLKFYDWYFSTDRTEVKIAYSVKDALEMDPMEIPELSKMSDKLLNTFPTDIFGCNYNIKHIQKKKVILFGTGDCFKIYVNRIKSLCRVSYVCDNDPKKWGKYYADLRCISPTELFDMENVYVVITLWEERFVKEVENQLMAGNLLHFERINLWLRHMNYNNFESEESYNETCKKTSGRICQYHDSML